MLILLGVTVVISFAAGWVLGGRLTNLAEIRFAWAPSLGVAVALGILPAFLRHPSWLSQTILLLAYALVAVFLLKNWKVNSGQLRVGLLVMLVGWSLNTTVIAVNGAMPLSLWAYRESGQHENPTPGQGGFFKIELANSETLLRFLGDAIPVRPIRQVVSLGDLILMAGATQIMVGGMRRSNSGSPVVN